MKALNFSTAPSQGQAHAAAAAPATPRPTFDAIRPQAHAAARQILDALWPGGTVSNGEWHAPSRAKGGPGDGLMFNLRSGQWAAFNGALTPDSGPDIISLYGAAKGLKPGDALRAVAEWLGASPSRPAPAAAPAPAPEREKPDNRWWEDPAQRTRTTYIYRKPDGSAWIQVERYTHKSALDGKGKPVKMFRQWDCINNRYFFNDKDGVAGWPMPDPRPIYNLDKILNADPDVPVVLCEGEKKADALLAVGILATSNIGGVRGVSNTDWSPLGGRRIVVWPDHDTIPNKDGRLPAEVWLEATRDAFSAAACTVYLVAPPKGRPSGWDAADATETERRALVTAALAEAPVAVPRPDPWAIDQWFAEEAFSASPAPVQWLLRDLIPLGMAGLFVAIGGAGKGMTLLDMGLSVAAGPAPGRTWEGLKVLGREVDAKGGVVIVCGEDTKDALERRLQSLDADGGIRRRLNRNLSILPMPNLGGAHPLFHTVGGIHQPSPAWHELCRRLRGIKDLRLVVLDPVAPFSAVPFDVEVNAASAITSACAQLAADTGAAVIISHHMRKDGGGRGARITTVEQARNAVLGSVGLVNGVRWVYGLYGAEDGQSRAALSEVRRAPTPAAMADDVMQGGLLKSNERANKRQHLFVRHEGTGRLEDVQLREPAQPTRLEVLVLSIRRANELGTPVKLAGTTAGSLYRTGPLFPIEVGRKEKLTALAEEAIGLGLLTTTQKGGFLVLPGQDLSERLEDLERTGGIPENYEHLFGTEKGAWERYRDDPDNFSPGNAPSTASREAPF